ncbi:MAG: SpoIIE family protein phosphatase [Bacteroidaceae bacterium]|nr:SpoIIE family protein phosphatase [Bacteroidaceae bacterium]
MNKLSAYIRRKLSVRVSLWVVLFAALIFIAALSFFFYQAREAVRQEAFNRATQILDKTSLRVEGILNRVEVATNMTQWLVQRHPDKSDSMFVYSRGMLLNNPDFYNCSIAFEPYHFQDKGRYFSAYSRHQGDSIRTIQGGSDNYQYFFMDWYLMPTLLDQPCWTEPYMDFDAPTNSYEMVTSYCQAIKDKTGKTIGVINTSLSLNWLSHTISTVKPYPNSYSIMLGRGGTYFVHPDTAKITRQTIFTQTLEQADTAMTALGHAMQRGEEGMKQMKLNGSDCYVFYKPLGKTGCSMAIVCPESDIFGGFDRLRQAVMNIVILGLLLMLFFFIRIITRELSPLRRLAKEAETIASGQFDTQLPELQRTDEIGQLSHSFADMQQSLVKYIGELKNTTAQKASIERDLHIASGIQMGMLPKNFPTYPDRDDVQIFASLVPAKEVGGDLFDFFFRDEKLFFCIGDVSGKGVPASLVMAVTRSVFRTVSAHESMPDNIVKIMNQALAEMNENNMFVTLFVGVLELNTGQLLYCNAGHDAPLLIGAGVGELPCDSNIPIGVMPSWDYSLQEAHIFTGTTIFLFTDGLTEAMDADKAQFRMERVNSVAADALAHEQKEPRQLIESMSKAVHEFVGNAEQSDDLTMMAIQYIKKQDDVKLHKTLVLPNDTQEVPRLNDFVQEVCLKAGFASDVTMQLRLAVEEAVVNVMNYAYPPGTPGNVTLEVQTTDTRIQFTIIDSGVAFDPTAIPEVDTTLSALERPIGGLGIHLVRQIMDEVRYERSGTLNVLTLTKIISAPKSQ